MAIRDLLRGNVPDEQLESVGEETADRHGESFECVRLLDADNWLSTPAVVNEQFFIKIISGQNTLVHGLLTTGRNVGVFASGSEGFFQRFGTPSAMAEHELESTRKMRELGVNVPEPLEAFEHEGYGIVVLEYLPDFQTLDELAPETVESFAPELFGALARMHEAELVHGDLRAENVLVADGELYFIDATKVDADGIADARAYDIACALAALEPIIGAGPTVSVAAEYYDSDVLVSAEGFLDFVNIRPDHSFDTLAIKGELHKRVE
ncbi:protein kinase family protein [Halovenus sp. WSH3]|uniref:non-specific serine/threonine protein kinase n=1 Tax=Halovenus carboxidivorans TaxID=2692199 RepID=A0A6B0T695_9EURY|nr:RIO1 family regulatory kinase/ATPase [Halovenus carboxidivorans]MXR50741.1 protein kinase family protein [Halovenus carboxidivorans]